MQPLWTSEQTDLLEQTPVEIDRDELNRWSPGHNPGAARRFLVHPAELRRRRLLCEPIVESLKDRKREFVAKCNMCDSRRSAILAQPDRYGFPSRTAMCLTCGLFYLLDRFDDHGYAEFYKDGTYRRLTALFSGNKQGIGEIQSNQTPYARNLIGALRGYLRFEPGAQLLDVGGSAGHVALEFKNHFGIKATVLDPAEQEVAAARKLGVEAFTGSIEQWPIEERLDLVLLCRTVEHLHDLKGVLSRIRRLLRPNGLLYCDIIDFTEACRLVGHPEAVTKIDHCYWLTQESAVGIFRFVGFEIVSMNLALQQPLIGFLLRPCDPSPWLPTDPLWTKMLLRNMQKTASEWQTWGHSPADAQDWLRRKAYLAKRAILRHF